ncbi:cobalamin-dependent protein [Balneolales bacterium ANBcel1]|nr:cobalamin-dependent protein [Balneolales bacterium ANBcel1]
MNIAETRKLKDFIETKRAVLLTDLLFDLQQESPGFDWDNYLSFYMGHLNESLSSNNTAVFSKFLSWSRSVGRHHSIKALEADTITKKLAALSGRHLPREWQEEFIRFLEESRFRSEKAEPEAQSFLEVDSGLESLASEYFETLISGDRNKASKLVMDAVAGGVPVKDIYLKVFQPGLWELGRLWQMNRISVGQEHFFTAATQMIISRLYPKIFSTERNGKRMMATAVGGELHEIGIRMVSDFFEMDGWDTYYIGANCPADELLEELQKQRPDLLGVSVTLGSHIGTAHNLIRQIRDVPELSGLKILIGGRASLDHPDLFSNMEADGFALDAESAVTTANEVTGS